MFLVNWNGLWNSFTTFWLPILGWIALIIAIFLIVKFIVNRNRK